MNGMEKEELRMKSIFNPQTIGTLSTKNGFVRSATFEGKIDKDGGPTTALVEMFEAMADGQIGLIITGMIEVNCKELCQAGMIRVCEDKGQASLKAIIDAVHAKGGKIMPQLAIIGSQTHVKEGAQQPIISPSGVEELIYKTESQEMTQSEIQFCVESFGKAAALAQSLGADGIQLHGAHGYLMSHFLTPYYNKRTDCYGGSLENRARFAVEIIESIRAHVTPDFPVWIKLNCDDFMEEGGFTFDDCKKVVPLLEAAGVNAIEISGGSVSSLPRQGVIRPIRRTKEPMYFLPYAKEIAELATVPVGVVGGFRNVEDMEEAFNTSSLAFISMSRPFIREPQLIRRWESGDRADSLCISCNRCNSGNDGSIQCIFNKAKEG